MSENWTPSQRLAIESRGGQILVGAAAGSGKTSVLVERIVSLITDSEHPVDADRLLVVTFTNAAAAEMAARVRARLARCIAQSPDDRRLRRQQLLLMRAQISTIDSFCSSILREHFSELDIAPDFTVGADAQLAQLRAQAMEEVLSEMYAEPDSGIETLGSLFGRAGSDKETARLIERLYDFETTLAFPKKWEKQCLEWLEADGETAKTPLGAFLLDYAARALGAAVSLCAQALELAGEDEVLALNYGDRLREDMAFAKQLLALCGAGDWDGCTAALRSYKQSRAGGKKGADEQLKEAVKALRDRVKEIFKELRERVFCLKLAESAQINGILRGPLQTLFSAKDRFEERYMSFKRSKRMFEFSDLERMTVELLSTQQGEPTEVARALRDRYEYLLVDEYQDTNEIQDLLFSLVSREEKNLFCVGDVKQSIYSFRRADPDIFLRRRAACRPSEQGLYPMRITLAENFRSSGPVVRAVNAVFAPVMTSVVGGTDYARGEGLIAGLEQAGVETPDPCGLELRLFSEGEEPAQIAAEISGMLREGYPVQDREGTRRCRESDFCILLRSPKERAQAYKDALETAGVRVWTDGADNLFDNSEVAVLLSLLRVVDNPRRDVDLAAVMLSPLFGFTSDDLVRLRLIDRRAPLYALVLQSGEEKCAALVRSLAALRAKRCTMAVDELLRFAADQTDAELLLCAGDELSRRRDNIRLFIETAAEYSRGAGGDLSAFLRVCERAAKSGKNVQRAFTPPQDAVCITSIHKSKGLEWPVVFVANADKRFNQSDSWDSAMLFDPRLGVGARIRQESADGAAVYIQKTLGYQAAAIASIERTTSEEMRVLYVALTRAKQKVYLTGEAADPEKRAEAAAACLTNGTPDPYLVGAQSSYLSWALLGLFASFPKMAGALAATGSYAQEGVRVRLGADKAFAEPDNAAAADAACKGQADPALVAALNSRAQFDNPRLALSALPTKLSVTALVKHGAPLRLSAPEFASRHAAAARRGTAIHLFMQCADYAGAAKSAAGELERLVHGGYLSKADAEEVDLRKITGLFESEFGQRILRAPQVLREYDFIDALPAGALGELPPELADERIMIQGIADCILLEEDGAVLIDYKSDRVREPQELIDRYTPQLKLYKQALDKQLDRKIKSCMLYSFHLSRTIELPL